MMVDTFRSRSLARALVGDKRGNFGIMTAILLPVVLATAGVAIDVTRMVQVKSELQNAADSASLAAASAMAGKGISEAEAMELARQFLIGQMANLITEASSSSDTGVPASEMLERIKKDTKVKASQTTTAGTGKMFDVTVDARYELALNGLTSLLGYKSVTLEASSTSQSATESKNALSMFLVVDRSGSMAEDTSTINESQPTKQESYPCYQNNKWTTCTRNVPNYVLKIDALKVAGASLLDTIKTADPEQKYARLGAVSFNDRMQTPTPLAWGTSKSLTYVNALTPSGRTNSADATQKAYELLTATSENTYHKNKNGQIPSKYIVLMTDGENNVGNADERTLATCDAAKAADIEVYTIAFMLDVPRARELMANCATDDNHFYEAADGLELIAAFREIGEKASQSATRLMN